MGKPADLLGDPISLTFPVFDNDGTMLRLISDLTDQEP